MALLDVTHTGGSTSDVTVTTASILLLPANRLRRYVLIRSLRSNTKAVFLRLNADGPAVLNQGVPLYPGDAYEIKDDNLYIDNIYAIAETGKDVELAIQEGA